MEGLELDNLSKNQLKAVIAAMSAKEHIFESIKPVKMLTQ